MPNTQSSEKALRRDKRREKRNLKRKKELKQKRKELENLLEENKIEEAEEKMSDVQKVIDKAAKTGVIHENKANRLKAKLAQKLAEAKQG